MQKLTHALYPGSFDVLTYGHLDLVRRASAMFSRVTVAVAHNPNKQPLFSVAEREEMIREGVRDLRNVQVGSFTGLTVKYAKQIGANVILRGLRAVSDFEFELQMAMMNETLEPGISTIFMAPAPAYSFLSSSLVKEIARFGGDVSQFVPPHVERLLIQRLKENGIR
ncbi:MAG: pantetheine-phosphate adenylyltransferase [Candidatus Hydrogenedentota bacterium]|jgi:pantetheine-phosphate adenylyltransferase|nr:MAG: pantetheine-phosphate adenylyltransferase [Candidatus Hydrogenedentota bacterium]GIX43616.1 MAG: phosphopantetheine adenylyltransferase [Candidatus Sumerlaea sp.]